MYGLVVGLPINLTTWDCGRVVAEVTCYNMEKQLERVCESNFSQSSERVKIEEKTKQMIFPFFKKNEVICIISERNV